MASDKIYKYEVRENIRVFNLSDGRKVPVTSPGYFETDDRRTALMIKEQYKHLIKEVGDSTAFPATKPAEEPAKPLLNVIEEDEDDWGGEEGTNGHGNNGQASTNEGSGEGESKVKEEAKVETKTETKAETKTEAKKAEAKKAETKKAEDK